MHHRRWRRRRLRKEKEEAPPQGNKGGASKPDNKGGGKKGGQGGQGGKAQGWENAQWWAERTGGGKQYGNNAKGKDDQKGKKEQVQKGAGKPQEEKGGGKSLDSTKAGGGKGQNNVQQQGGPIGGVHTPDPHWWGQDQSQQGKSKGGAQEHHHGPEFDPRKNTLQKNRTGEWKQFAPNDGTVSWYENCWIGGTPVYGTMVLEWMDGSIAKSAITGEWHEEPQKYGWSSDWRYYDVPAVGAPIGAPIEAQQQNERRPPPPTDFRQFPGVEPRGPTTYGTWGHSSSPKIPEFKKSKPWIENGKNWYWPKASGYADDQEMVLHPPPFI